MTRFHDLRKLQVELHSIEIKRRNQNNSNEQRLARQRDLIQIEWTSFSKNKCTFLRINLAANLEQCQVYSKDIFAEMRLFYSTQFTQTHTWTLRCLYADSLDGSRANKEFVTQTRNTNTSWTANSINFSSFIHVYQINCPRFNGAYSQEKNLRCTKSAQKGTSSLLQLHTLYSFIWQLSDECFIAARAIPILCERWPNCVHIHFTLTTLSLFSSFCVFLQIEVVKLNHYNCTHWTRLSRRMFKANVVLYYIAH